MNKISSQFSKIKTVVSLLVIMAVTLTSSITALAGSLNDSHTTSTSNGFIPSGNNDVGGSSTLTITTTGGYKVSLLYVGKDKYYPVNSNSDDKESNTSKDSNILGGTSSTTGSGEDALLTNLTPYAVTGNSYYNAGLFASDKYLGHFAIGSMYFVEDESCLNEIGVKSLQDGSMQFGRHKGALKGKVVNSKDDIKAVLASGDSKAKSEGEIQEQIYEAFLIPEYDLSRSYEDTFGKLEMTSIDDDKLEEAKRDGSLAHNQSIMQSLLETMLKGYGKNTNTAKFIQEYGLDVATGANTESEFILLVEPLIKIKDSSGTPYYITANSYCIGCSCDTSAEYKSFPAKASNFVDYLVGTNKDKPMFDRALMNERGLGGIGYFIGYKTKYKDGKTYPNGHQTSNEAKKTAQALVTRCSYTGWITVRDGKKAKVVRSTGFTTSFDEDHYKWGFGTLASRDVLGGNPSPAVMSSTNLSLISDAGIPIINTGLFGELAEGEFGDVENLDTITSDIEMALETMTEWYKEGFISTEEMLTGVLADYFGSTLESGEMIINSYGEHGDTSLDDLVDLDSFTEEQQNEFKAVASILINGLSVENDSFNTPENVQLLKYLYLRTATNSSSSTGISGEMVTKAIQKAIEDAKYTEGTFKIDDSSSSDNSNSLGEKSIALGDKNTILMPDVS